MMLIHLISSGGCLAVAIWRVRLEMPSVFPAGQVPMESCLHIQIVSEGKRLRRDAKNA